MLHAPGMRHPPWLLHAIVSHHNKRHNNCAAYYCGFARSSRAQKLFCEWNTRYALVARALAIFSHWGGKIKFYSIRGSLRDYYQLPSILLIFEVSYKTNVSLRAVQWQGFRIRWKIATHCSTQLRFVEQCVAIFHLMRNPWPSHGSAWNICIPTNNALLGMVFIVWLIYLLYTV